MSSSRPHYSRRELLQATAGGIAGAVCLSAPATAQSDEAPDSEDYDDIIDGMDGEGSEETPYVVTDVVELQAMAGEVTSNYELDTDIDASVTESWNDGAGFTPIGDQENPFVGRVFGNGNEIQGLTIDRPDTDLSGMFGLFGGLAEQLTLTDVTVNGNNRTGGLAGITGGALIDTTVSGTVTGGDRVGGIAGLNNGQGGGVTADTEVSGANWAGGLFGSNRGKLVQSSATSDVSATAYGGTFAGINRGRILHGSSEGTVTGEASIGGSLGENSGTVFATTTTATVEGTETVGLFVGENWTEVAQSTADGSVTGTKAVGGFSGENYSTITGVSTAGDVTGESLVGGLVGWNAPGGSLSNSFVTGGVSGQETVGALVGRLGWEFQDEGEQAELRSSYWNSDAIQYDAVGLDEPGGGETVIESVAGLGASEMQGEAATSNMQALDFNTVWRPISDDYPRTRALTPSVYELVDAPEGKLVVSDDESASVTVTVQNTGEWPGIKSVEFRIEGETARSQELRLEPGEETTVTFSIPADQLGRGAYNYTIWTRDGQMTGVLVVEDSTGDGTETATDTTGDGTDTPTQDSPTDSSDGDGPGFGITAAVSGLGGAAYLLSRRRSGTESDYSE
jgi:PGF-CTERM protein